MSSRIKVKSFVAYLTIKGYPDAVSRLDEMVDKFLSQPNIEFHSLKRAVPVPEINTDNSQFRKMNRESFEPCLIRELIYFEKDCSETQE